MQIKEARKAKRILETEIYEAVKRFEEETSLSVTKIEVESSSCFDTQRTTVGHITVKTELK